MKARSWLRGAAGIGTSLLCLLVLTFVIGRVMPLDPVLAIVGPDADRSTYEQVYRQLGLDQPLWVQFGRYLLSLAQGDLGQALLTGNPVTSDLLRVLPATAELATLALLIGVLLGVPLGVLAATHHGRWPDHLARVLGLLGHSTPVFWFGMMGLLVFYAWLGWAGGIGRIGLAFEGNVPTVTGLLTLDAIIAGDGAAWRSAMRHLLLPAAVLGLHTMAYLSRMTRSFMLAQLSQEYILTARVKGLTERQVAWGHAFRNIRVQLLTIVALAYGGLLEGAVLTETVFGWPGFGSYLTGSLLLGDMNAVMGSVLVIGVLFVSLNLLTDALYRVFDPRAAA
jgi:peptide/nickel transport system permease protein